MTELMKCSTLQKVVSRYMHDHLRDPQTQADKEERAFLEEIEKNLHQQIADELVELHVPQTQPESEPVSEPEAKPEPEPKVDTDHAIEPEVIAALATKKSSKK